MPNILRKLMAPSGRSSRHQDPPPIGHSYPSSRPGSSRIDTEDLTDLAEKVLGKLESRQAAAVEPSTTTDRVGNRLRRQKHSSGTSASASQKKARQHGVRVTAPVASQGADDTTARLVGYDGQKTLQAISKSLDMVDQLQAPEGLDEAPRVLLKRCGDLLPVQRDEVRDAMIHMERGRYPALRTLRQVYERVIAGLNEIGLLAPLDAELELETLVQLLEEGPDYLIDTFLIELIIHHAETLDSTLAAEVRDIYKKAAACPGDLGEFRKAAQAIVAYACAIPEEDLDDELGREAYRTIGVLVKQLKMRVESEQPRSEHKPTSSEAPQAILEAPLALTPTCYETQEDHVESLGAAALQARYGTGLLPARPAVPIASTSADSRPMRGKAKASPPPSATSSLDSISLYDYRGQILTASALDLVMRQEALALADSTGQYTGEVSWDDIRQAWIPNWVIKLKPEDLAPGEIPSTNPADYEVKKEDEFGNKIGWTDEGEMYYEEEPTFELK